MYTGACLRKQGDTGIISLYFLPGEMLMCGRYYIENNTPDERLTAIIAMMEKNHPGNGIQKL